MRFSPAEIEARRHTLNASEVRPLATQKPDELMRLWRIKTGREQPEDLSGVWIVGVGIDTEQRHLNWHEVPNTVLVTRRGERVVHPLYEMFACTLDGWLEPLGCPLEVKYTKGREPLEVVQERYMPQLTWQMCCTTATRACLSVARGGDDPMMEMFALDVRYADELMRRGLQFWECVKRDIEPMPMAPLAPPVSQGLDYNMTGNDSWRRYAEQWLQTYGAAKSAEEAQKVLKSLVPADARKCFGDGVRITRDRAGRLSLMVDE